LQVGAPPEVAARLTAMAQELEARQRTALGGLGAATEPELDQFMVSYQLTVNDPLSAKEYIFLCFVLEVYSRTVALFVVVFNSVLICA